MLVLDDIGYSDTTVTQDAKVVGFSTPNLKRLAIDEGVLLTNYYTQTVCSPTRSSLMTGRWPFTMGMQHVTTIEPGSTAHLPLSVPTIAEVLRSKGYATHAIGKWHLGYAAVDYTPTRRGFESFLGYLQGQIDYYNKTIVGGGLPFLIALDFWNVSQTKNQDYRHVYREAVGTYSLDFYEKRFNDIVRNYTSVFSSDEDRKAHPLFLYYAHQSAHIPIQARRLETKRCKDAGPARQVYCSMIQELDDVIGRMEDTLKKFKLWDDLVIVATTDNGGMVPWTVTDPAQFPVAGPDIPIPGSVGSNYPRRGTKMTLYEGGVRSLGFITGGALHEEHRGKKISSLLHAVDLSALAYRVGTKDRRARFGHGIGIPQLALKSDDPTLDFSNEGREEVPINVIYGGKIYSAIRFGAFKLIVGGAAPLEGITTTSEGWFPADAASYPELPTETSPSIQLFNLENDPNERINLAYTNFTVVAEGLRRLERYASLPEYMEPQPNIPDPRGFPQLHGGVWAPFLRHVSAPEPVVAMA